MPVYFPDLVVENARLATTFSNDNNYPRETSLPIRRERLLFFIYGQAHYFCASKHMKNSPLARARARVSVLLFSPPFPSPSPPFARLPRLPTRATTESHGFIKLVAAKRRLVSFSLFLPFCLSCFRRVIFSSDLHSHAIRRSVVASSGLLLPGDSTRQSCIDHSTAIRIARWRGNATRRNTYTYTRHV